MTDLLKKFHQMSPQQQQLLRRRMREKNIPVPLPENPSSATAPTEKAASRPAARSRLKMDFSFFFFSADGAGESQGKYDFLLDCARYADRHGFSAVWTPERHFQTFGGLYPNPSVMSAAMAMITERVQIRAGSVVLPLHSPVRVAEEWALVDNLSQGRAAISFATGWHRHDYVIAPDHYQARRQEMWKRIPIVLDLWAGKTVTLPGVDGEPTQVRTLPRPIQKELPFWVTATSAATWQQAGAIGANILTALGASVEELAQSIRSYRQARIDHGHDPRKGIVSLMLHTYLGRDLEQVRQKVRQPLKQYLKHYMRQFQPLMENSMQESLGDSDNLLEFAVERYFNHGSLLGTPDKCSAMIEILSQAGVDEAACLLDFGLDSKSVLESLELLNDLRRRWGRVLNF